MHSDSKADERLQVKLIVCFVALTSLSLVAVRQGHELKNAAYDTARLLVEIDKYQGLKINLSADCSREGSPRKLLNRVEHMELALVHPFDPSQPVDAPEGRPGLVMPMGTIRVASAPKAASGVTSSHLPLATH